MPALPTLAQHPQPDLASACRASSRGRTPKEPRCKKQSLIWDRLFKFPQMDFEMAIWEMTSLLIAPKKVFKSIYYHVSGLDYPNWPSNYADHVIGPRNVSLLIPGSTPCLDRTCTYNYGNASYHCPNRALLTFEQKPRTHGTGLIRHSPTYYHSSSSSQPSHGALLIRRASAQSCASPSSSSSYISLARHCLSQQLDTLSSDVYSVRTELPPLWLVCGAPVAEDEVPLRACLRSQERRSNWNLDIVLT